jgi:cholesterol transport system auxiliary component
MKRLRVTPAAPALLVMAAAGAAASSLAGCAGSLLQTRRTEPDVYMLTAHVPAAPAAVLRDDVSVQQPRVRAGLDNERIAVLHADHRIDYFSGARWSAPLGALVQDLALQALRGGARLRNVTAEDSAFAGGFWLEIEVLDFQAEYASTGLPSAHVHLLARIGNAGDRHMLGAVDADAVRPAAADRLGAIVEAYEAASDAALAEVVAGTLRTLGGLDAAAAP